MKNTMKISALAVAAGMMCSAAAYADTSATSGGLKISTDDGRFEGVLGGRIQYDLSSIKDDAGNNRSTANGAYLRRAYISLSGKLYGFKYKLEDDIGGTTANKEIWLGKDALGGFIKVGHMQPAYGMEELTSSNDLLFVERPFISNNTIYNGREYQNGISYDAHVSGFTAFVSYYDATAAASNVATSPGGGRGAAGRFTYAPLADAGSTLHVGLSYDDVRYRALTAVGGAGVDGSVAASYADRNGPKLTLLAVPAAGFTTEQTADVELAGAFGPGFFQSEYAQAKFGMPAGASSQTLNSYYVQGSFFVTGETKPYKADKGVFGNPKPINDFGAIELKARYDYVKNKDAANAPKARMISVGANYYFNPNVRFMLDYNMGKAETTTTSDSPKAIVARAQLSF